MRQQFLKFFNFNELQVLITSFMLTKQNIHLQSRLLYNQRHLYFIQKR